MTALLRDVGAITLFVEELDRTAAFYRDVLGLKAVHEDDDAVAFDFGNAVINLLRAPAARELIEPGVVAGPEAGARAQMTVAVEDVDTVCVELVARGVTLLNGPMDRPWGLRTAAFTDPAGHVWEVAHALGRPEGS